MRFISKAILFSGAVVLTAAHGTTLHIGGAPEKAKADCIAAAAHRFKVRPDGVAVRSSAMGRDRMYLVSLEIANGRRRATCIVDENGAVREVKNAR
jgi:hypothetical protein